jgi:hypothetical protein
VIQKVNNGLALISYGHRILTCNSRGLMTIENTVKLIYIAIFRVVAL